MASEEALQNESHLPNPMVKASYFSKYFSFWWINGLFKKGNKRTLENSDFYELLPEDESKTLTDKLESLWWKEVKKAKIEGRKPRLRNATIRFLGMPYLLCGIYVFLEEAARIIQPIFIGKLVSYFVLGSSVTRLDAYIYAMNIILCSLVMATLHHPLFFKAMRFGMHLRVTAGSLVYRKALRLSSSALSNTTTGHIVNLVTSDLQKLEQLTLFLHYLWAGPLGVLVIAYLAWRELGAACLPGIVLMILLAPFQGWVGQYFAVLRKKIASLTDERIKIMNEVISGMRVIKMYTWEDSFAELVADVRGKESCVIRQANRARALNSALYLGAIPVASLVMFSTYVMTGHMLTSTKVFTVIGLFFSAKLPMTVFIPFAVMFLRESFISEERLMRFLMQEEKDRGEAYRKISVVPKYEKPVLKVNNITASWNKDSGSVTLKDISFEVKPGELFIVIGPVGCGKSSLLMAVLGELPVTKGSVEVKGRIGYASQQAWIFSGSVRENIVFGHEFDEDRYKKTIAACALAKDLVLFPNGDKTLVGERGVSLSGGQRARINLARAVYYDGDVYLLDDPLSAVDTRVGKHLFEKCIRGLLKDKMCILVTHQLQFVGDSSRVICLDEGRCINQGTYAELTERGFDVGSIISSYEDADSAIDSDRINLQETLPPHTFLMPERYKERPNSMIGLRSGPVKYSRSISAPPLTQDLGDDKVVCRNRSATIEDQLVAPSSETVFDVTQVTTKDDVKAEKEARQRGTISSSVYKDYFLAGASVPVLFIALLLMISAQIVVMLSEWWLAQWADAEEKRSYELKQNLMTNSTLYPDDNRVTRDRNIIIYATLVASGFILAFVRSFLCLHITVSASQHLHDLMFAKVLRAPIYFFDTNPLGRILNRFSKDICQMDDLLPVTYYDFFQLILMAMAIMLLNVVGIPYLLVVAVPVAALFIYIRRYYVKTAREVKRIDATNHSPVYSHLSTTLHGLTTLRAFKAQDRFVSMFHSYMDNQSSSWFLYISCSRWLGSRLDFICFLFISFATLTPLILREAGTVLSAGLVGLCLTYAKIMTGMFQFCIRQSAEVENLMTSVERVIDYTRLEQEPQMLTAETIPKGWPKYGIITAERMYYAHHSSLPYILKNLNFCIRANEKVGVVGRTGAGKSSLMAALYRMAEPTGLIRIDGISITDIGLSDLRSRLSIIPQDPVLFSGTVAQNLDPFSEHPDYALWNALDEVQLKEMVEELPEKLQTELAEAGSNFSVGQRQLVCLARAILRHNRILIIDEATANVDQDTDTLVQETIRNKFRECTVLTIAHRLNTIMDSDRVMVLDEGRLIEFDEPYLLLSNESSLFYQMAQQTGKSSTAKLLETARQAYELRHEASGDSALGILQSESPAVDQSFDRQVSCDENQPLLMIETAL